MLILRDVLGYRAAEVAEMLEVTDEAVTSALKRARATLAERDEDHPPAPTPGSAQERRLVEAFVTAFADHDVDAIVALLTEDAWIRMPPLPFEYQGHQAIWTFFTALKMPGGRSARCILTRANGQPTVATYVLDTASGTWRNVGVIVLTLTGDRVRELTRFEPAILPAFGLPAILPADEPGSSTGPGHPWTGPRDSIRNVGRATSVPSAPEQSSILLNRRSFRNRCQ